MSRWVAALSVGLFNGALMLVTDAPSWGVLAVALITLTVVNWSGR